MAQDWKGIRLGYNQGMTQAELQKKYGVAASTLRRRIRSEGWVRNGKAEVQKGEPTGDVFSP